ncbi:hypothetical protein ACWD6R_23010 [Streptomyces sp. NPDC005151]
MVISRTVRIAAVVALAVLAGFFAAGQIHAQDGKVVAGDTTWSAPADTVPADETAWPVPADTTWSAPADGEAGGGVVPVVPRDTTW